MWFQLAAERAFPSQTVGPCQGPSSIGAHKKKGGPPQLPLPTGHPRDLSPLENSAVLSHCDRLTWNWTLHTLEKNPAVPNLCPRTAARCPPPARLPPLSAVVSSRLNGMGGGQGVRGRAGGRGGGVWK